MRLLDELRSMLEYPRKFIDLPYVDHAHVMFHELRQQTEDAIGTTSDHGVAVSIPNTGRFAVGDLDEARAWNAQLIRTVAFALLRYADEIDEE